MRRQPTASCLGLLALLGGAGCSSSSDPQVQVPLLNQCGMDDPIDRAREPANPSLPGNDPALPGEPAIPVPCPGGVLDANYPVLLTGNTASDGLPNFNPASNPYDTTRINAAINACAASLAPGQKGSVKLQVNSTDSLKVAFVSGPIILKAGVTLWVDKGATLFASQNPRHYDVSAGACGTDANNNSNGCNAFITVKGTSSRFLVDAGIVGEGVIDGLGGEPIIGGFNGDPNASWWDVAQHALAQSQLQNTTISHSNPRLIDVTRSRNFTLYKITLRNSPKFHVGIESDGFMVWGVTVQTPSKAKNALGRGLTPVYARNTDAIDPYEANDGYIVYSNISTGDDNIALKCGKFHLNDTADRTPSCRNITVAHNHFGTGHGMSIGSETNAGLSDGTGVGVDGLHVYDLSIDGTLPTGGAPVSDVNGIRLKSDQSRGGIVQNVSYEDVCIRGVGNPILVSPAYDPTKTGSALPTFRNVVFRNVHVVKGDCSVVAPTNPVVTLVGIDADHISDVTLDNVVVDDFDMSFHPDPSRVISQFVNVKLGPGPVNFDPRGDRMGPGVTVTNGVTNSNAAPNSCTHKFVRFPGFPQ